VHRGGTVVRTRWGGGGGGAVRSRNVRQGEVGPKTATELLWLGCGLKLGRRRWWGVLWGYCPPSRARLKRGDGG
jgi:hypothetical protein